MNDDDVFVGETNIITPVSPPRASTLTLSRYHNIPACTNGLSDLNTTYHCRWKVDILMLLSDVALTVVGPPNDHPHRHHDAYMEDEGK